MTMTRCCMGVFLLALSSGAHLSSAFATPHSAATSVAITNAAARGAPIRRFGAPAGAGADKAAPPEGTDEDATEEAEISAILRPSYPIEPIPLRIGHGFDIHKMVPLSEAGQPIVVGGVVIDHEDQKWLDKEGAYADAPNSIYLTQLGVLAHSDGDVIYHSLVDAIFGALTLPDIGQVFQDTDPRWFHCDSSKFMEHAYEVMRYYGYQIGNVDVTLILERPKVAIFKPRMKENIVRLLHTTEGRVNIKARTHEKVDSMGELRSLSCHVVVTLEKDTEKEKE